MPVRMMVFHSSIESLIPPRTATPELRCLFSLVPDPKEDDRNDSDALTKATCLRLCDAVEGVEGEVDKAAEMGRGGVD
jgi:hypothetical protein